MEANMHNIKHEQSFPFDNNTLVVLKAKCPEGEAIIDPGSGAWFVFWISGALVAVGGTNCSNANGINSVEAVIDPV